MAPSAFVCSAPRAKLLMVKKSLKNPPTGEVLVSSCAASLEHRDDDLMEDAVPAQEARVNADPQAALPQAPTINSAPGVAAEVQMPDVPPHRSRFLEAEYGKMHSHVNNGDHRTTGRS
ncbi:hypothetical protein HPB50_007750 [Hyalomma asiaticum]|uniref:Uncharacterized protein n=1 Tax=Hyalomma asiaticum TaxID=266040 RepID=A0ACB7TGP6_HYAAI|nr:hypothetical protein HPB50_007750 [Hyalomma asiaticum]